MKKLLLFLLIGIFMINLVSGNINYCNKCWILENNTESIITTFTYQTFDEKIPSLELKKDFKIQYDNYLKEDLIEQIFAKQSLRDTWNITNTQIDNIEKYPINLYYKNYTVNEKEKTNSYELIDISYKLKSKIINLISGERFSFKDIPFENNLVLKIGFDTITYTAGTNIITLDDSVGAGDSWINAYTMQDVLTDVANTSIVSKQGANAYDVSARMQFNDGVYFVSENEFVEVKPNPINPSWTWRAETGSHLRFGEYDATDKFCSKGSFWKIYVDSTTLTGGNYYKGETLIYGSTMWNDASSYTDSISFEPDGTTKIYASVMAGKAYMRTTDINFQDVKWINEVGTDYGLMVASGYDYIWAGITTIHGSGNGGIFMSGTTTSDVDLYDVTFQGCTRDVLFSGSCNWRLRLINSPTFSTVSGMGLNRPGMRLCYTFNVFVSDNNVPLSGAVVTLKNNNGTTVVAMSTGIDGKLPTDQIVVQKSYRHSSNGGTIDFNDHILTVEKTGYATYTTNITIDREIKNEQIGLDALTYSFDDIMNTLYNKNPLTIISSVGAFYTPNEETSIYFTTMNANNHLVNSTINVNVTYPNGSILSSGVANKVCCGRYKYNFTLPSNTPSGVYPVNVDANYSGYETHDTLTFLTNPQTGVIIKNGAIIINK